MRTLLVTSILALILVCSWFKDGDLMGYAEGALPFYKISRYLDQTSYAWTAHPGLGNISLITTASKPTYQLLTLIQDSGIAGYQIQAAVFWFLLVSAGVGIYLFTKEFFPELPEKYLFLAILFYWFNPISLVNIWNRFLLNYIFFFGALPLLCFLFIKGLRAKSYFWGLLLITTIGIYSYIFSYLAFSLLIWIAFGIFTLFFILLEKESRVWLFYLKYVILVFVLFVLSNSWWISQLLTFQSSFGFDKSFQELFNTASNLGVLDAISQKLGNLTHIFRMSHAYFFTQPSMEWVKLFNYPLLVAVEYFIFGIIFYSFIKNYQEKSFFLLGSILFLVIFLVKGSNPPFGEVYSLLFQNLSFLQVFRNPFEKFGYLQSMLEASLFAISLYYLQKKKFPLRRQYLYLFFFFFITFIWGFPFFTNLVFTNTEAPSNIYSIGYKVKVPPYYSEASDWLQHQGSNFRLIGFPITEEGVTYNWEKGYSGVELSSTLFSTPGVFFNTAVPMHHDLVPKLQPLLFEEESFYRIANIINARYYLVRDDVNYQIRALKNPEGIKRRFAYLEEQGEVKKVASFGKLTIWENLNWFDTTFYPVLEVVAVSSKFDKNILSKVDPSKGRVLLNKEMNLSKENTSNIKLQYKKINPAKYALHISTDKPFILIFSELFNGNWQAIYPDKKIVDNHLIANYFANAWMIDRVGEYDIEILFKPQVLFETGQKLSLITHSIVILLLGYLYLRTRGYVKNQND